MYLRFEIFIVVAGHENVLVTTVFNDAFNKYLLSKQPVKRIEVWDEGVCTETYRSLDDFIKAGRVKSAIKEEVRL